MPLQGILAQVALEPRDPTRWGAMTAGDPGST
jgi:hypothetical protein